MKEPLMSRRALLNQSLSRPSPPAPGVWRMVQTVLALYPVSYTHLTLPTILLV